ncbi:F0F1 ATP synthase subunit A, partial [Clostridioides difficile]
GNVVWQTAELGKVDQGGGGTIAHILANQGAEVIDCGVGVLNIPVPLHLYFDLFAGLLQAYIFIMLTMVFISSAGELD